MNEGDADGQPSGVEILTIEACGSAVELLTSGGHASEPGAGDSSIFHEITTMVTTERVADPA